LFDTANNVIGRKAYLKDNVGKALYFKCDSVKQGDLFGVYKDYTGLTPNDQMIETETWTSQTTDMIHVSYQQYRHGIFVEKSVFTEHIYEGSVVFTSGAIVEDLPINYVPTINEINAIEIAKMHIYDEIEVLVIDSLLIQEGDDWFTLYDTITFVRTTSFPWEYDSIPNRVGFWDTIQPQEYLAEAEVVYAYIPDYSNDTGFYKLCYRVKLPMVSTDSTLNYNWIYIDALTGIVYKEHDGIRGTGSFNNLYYGNQNLDNAWIGGFYWRYILHANNGERNIRTLNYWADKEKHWKNSHLPHNGNSTNWGTNHRHATSAHFSVTQAFDYFESKHGWQGYKGWDPKIFVSAYPTFNGAAFRLDDEVISIGNIQQNIPLVVTDVAAHEFTHGIAKYRTTNTATTHADAVAIEESFCDIFGLNANRWGRPNNWSWRLGEEAQNFFIRDMSAPWNAPIERAGFTQSNTPPCFYPSQYPSTFQDRYTGHCERGRVYINMNIMNYWYYLLEQGGSQLGVTVNGIGGEKSRNIAWLTLHSYARGEPDFREIRVRTEQAAIELYGGCSAELFEVCNAWDAVGVPGICPCIKFDLVPNCWDIVNNDPLPNESFQGSVEETKLQNRIQIYPNPTESTFLIEFEHLPKSFEIILKDLTGKIILSQKNVQVFDLTNFNNGIYFVEILLPQGKQVHKVIKN